MPQLHDRLARWALAVAVVAGVLTIASQCARRVGGEPPPPTEGGVTMHNVSMKVEKDELVIRIDLTEEGTRSSSGKSFLIASTGGSAPAPGRPDVKVGINVFRPIR